MEHLSLPLLIALIGLAAVAVVVLIILGRSARIDRPPRKHPAPLPPANTTRPHVTAISEPRSRA